MDINSTTRWDSKDHTGKRSAVRNNSGAPVDHSGPGLGVGPTTPLTAGRKPEACPPNSFFPSQHKSGPEVQEPGGFLGAAERAQGCGAKRSSHLFLTQYRLIVTSNWGGVSIVAGLRFAAKPRILQKRASTGSTASAGTVAIARQEKQSASSTRSARRRRRCSCGGSSP